MESAPEQPQEPSAESTPAPSAHACPNCSAPAAAGQRWCLECGAELPQGRRSGLRPVVGIATTLTVLVGAASAAGFTLLQDGKKPPPPATTIAQTPPPETTPPTDATVPPPDTTLPDTSGDLRLPDTSGSVGGGTGSGTGGGSGTSTPPDNTVPDITDGVDTSTPNDPPPDDNAPDVGTDNGRGSVTDDPDAGRGERRRETPKPRLKPTNIALGTAAVVYGELDDSADPGDPGAAVDGSRSTAWRTPLQADAAAPLATGVYVDLAGQERLTKAVLYTSTPGMSFELYAAKSGPPASITGTGWTHIVTKENVGATTTISLGGQRFRYVLVWVTGLPPEQQQAAISELSIVSPQVQ